MIGDFQGGTRGFAKKQSVWTVDANDSSKLAPSITSIVVLQESLSGNTANTPLLLLATDHVLLAELQPEVGPVQRQIPLGMTPQKLLYSHVLKCLVVGARTLDDRPILKFIDPDTGEDLSLPLHGQTREPADFISGLGKTGDRILCLDEWHIESKNKNFYFILVATNGGPGDGGRVLIVSTQVERPAQGMSRGKISFWTRHRIKGPKEPVYAVTAAGRKIQAAFHSELVYYRLDEGEKKLTQVSTTQLDSEPWKLSILPDSPHTLALTRRDSLCVLEEAENDADGFEVRHVDPYTPHGLDMLEIAGGWPVPPTPPVISEPPPSIVLVADQECGLNGLWIPWDSPDKDCEVLFETDLPSTVRRLRLGRTLPSWSREARGRHGNMRFGLLPASAGDSEVLGMGIDGSLQHFTLLDLGAWRFLRFLQNVSETSAELYPFTYMQFESAEDEEAFDPRPSATDRDTLERQVDGDLMQRILDRRALEGLVGSRREWAGYFMEYLDGVDSGERTRFEGVVGEEERTRTYFRLAYEILEYFLVPII
ncbi:putative thermotolerance protein [Diaporthe ampelina]|uniref:Putative thermotolerance protein n=1 Tax=Diaporthe ampelina TaxID=1214573 RepID=A0A0G2HUL4_9PEZI|nr:putative thermotolerance protein [Diaporthe ampelina]